jgi:hypothetical protein
VAAGGLPDLLTVEEAAVLLRIGRNKAYDLTRQWRATNGRCGLPVVEFGHTLRVPRHALERVLGVEFTAWPAAPASESLTPMSDPEPASDPLDGGRRVGDATIPAEGTGRVGITDASNVTPIRRHRPRGPSGQLSLFQPASPAVEGP